MVKTYHDRTKESTKRLERPIESSCSIFHMERRRHPG